MSKIAVCTDINGKEVLGKSIDEEFTRYDNSKDNWLNYTKVELAEKEKHLKDMCRDYPHLPEAWCEMVYDYAKQKGPDEITRIIASGELEKPSKKNRQNGGVIKDAIAILDRDDLEEKDDFNIIKKLELE
jgi:hypothetical protein